MKKSYLLPLALLTAVALTLACGKKKDAPAPETPVQVHLVPDMSAQQPGWVAATLSAQQKANLSTRMAASVKKVHVTEGQKVAQGALLVSLSDADLQSGYKAAQTAVETARTQVKRMENLAAQKAAVPAELDMAKVQLAQAEAQLAQVKANIGFTQIRAPFSGVVQSRKVNDGDFVGPGMSLIDLEGSGELELTGTVGQAEAQRLSMGMKVSFESGGKTGEAQITGLSSGNDPVSHRGSIRAKVIKGAEDMRSGSFARIQLPGAKADDKASTVKGAESNPDASLLVPKTALINRGELTGVFIVKDGRANLRWIAIGECQTDACLVRAGIKPGDQVIDNPGQLKDGQKVEVVR